MTQEQLLAQGAQFSEWSLQTIEGSKDRLVSQVTLLCQWIMVGRREQIMAAGAQGSTALGPALAIAVGMRPQEIVVCTDGEVCVAPVSRFDDQSVAEPRCRIPARRQGERNCILSTNGADGKALRYLHLLFVFVFFLLFADTVQSLASKAVIAAFIT
jgi:hypothetical protein